MISISHSNNDLLILISAKDQHQMDGLVRDCLHRYPEYCLAAKEPAQQCFDGRWVVVLVPTVELF